MAEATTIWVDLTLEDLDEIMPDGVDRGELVLDGAFSKDKGLTLTLEFVQADHV